MFNYGGRMAGNSVCSNCGNELKAQWLVCKNCHQARWNLITPYFIWGALFVVFAWWALAQKILPYTGSDNLFTLMLPVVGSIFGVIGVVMLLIGIIAALRGMSVRK